MKVPLKWLSEYVDITVPLKELAEKLTMAGVEVGEVKTIGGDWEYIVVGRIVGIDAHPDADRLRLATVDVGTQQVTVVCGAPNLVVGDKVAFAHVGARLVDGHKGELVQLKPAKIRGVVSEGMICSEMELGISDSHEGIMVLTPEASVGAPLSEYLGDTVFDLDVTPNRPDCLSVIGIAREVAALTGNKTHISEVHYDELENAVDSFVSVEIVEPELCPRYCASLISGIKIAPSPQWLQQRLLACGMRPINNIVDVTNYVMMEYGQPLHAFDYKGIRGERIIVRRAEEGELIDSLDGIERTLSKDMLVIADKERAIAVAGIMGGLDSEVTDNSTTVVIESANFNQAVIYRGSSGLKLSSEASLRFGKGLSRDLPLEALRRATQLMLELAGGKAAKGIVDVYPGKRQMVPILMSTTEAERLLGIEVEVDEMVRMLELLGFDCERTELPLQVRVSIPWWRTDVNCTADLAEEIARIVGYDNIPTTMISAPIPMHEPVPMQSIRQRTRNTLVSCGFQEVLTYALTNLEALSKLSPELQLIGQTPVKLANPMSWEMEYLRPSLRANILSVLSHNQRHNESGIRLFELGKIFIPRAGDLPMEKEMLCAVLTSTQPRLSWRSKAEPVDFFVAKGVVETLMDQLGLAVDFKLTEDESLYSGRNANILADNNQIGVVGELHPRVVQAFELSDAAYLIEIDMDKVLSLIDSSKKYQPISRYPSTSRDVALVVDEQITYQQVYDITQDFPLVKQVTLFDLYSGEQVPAGKKSFAFKIVYQSSTSTLTDNEVDKVQQQIINRLSSELGAALRA